MEHKNGLHGVLGAWLLLAWGILIPILAVFWSQWEKVARKKRSLVNVDLEYAQTLHFHVGIHSLKVPQMRSTEYLKPYTISDFNIVTSWFSFKYCQALDFQMESFLNHFNSLMWLRGTRQKFVASFWWQGYFNPTSSVSAAQPRTAAFQNASRMGKDKRQAVATQ